MSQLDRCTTAQFMTGKAIRTSDHSAADPGSRTDRFLWRIDAHLPTLRDNRARRVFLDQQIEGWQARYARFLAPEGASEPTANCADPPHAADFLLTITALAARRGAFAGNRGEPRMSGP